MASPEVNARKMIEDLQYHAGKYAKYALQARKKYIELRLRQDNEISKVYLRAIMRISQELKSLGDSENNLKANELLAIQRAIAEEFERVNGEIDELVKQYILDGVVAGTSYSQSIVLSAIDKVGLNKAPVIKYFAKVNSQAAEAIYARTYNGLATSDRIWMTSKRASTAIRNIIQEAVVTGRDAVEVAEALERYIQTDARTLSLQYPKMMERVKSRVPLRLPYEALRLARTEMTAAFGEGVIAAGKVSPSYIGVRWILSPSHPVRDICDTFANKDVGLGKGVYPKGQEPRFPPHPNCLCTLLPVYEEPDKLEKRLKEWLADPSSHPDIEEWYRNIYTAA